MAVVIRMTAGLILWAAGFSLLYALHGFGCAAGWQAVSLGPATGLGLVLIAAWTALLAAAFALSVALFRGAGRKGPPFAETIARASAIAGSAGLLLMGAPVLLPAHCL